MVRNKIQHTSLNTLVVKLSAGLMIVMILMVSLPSLAKYDSTAPQWRAVLEKRVKLKGTGSTVDYAGLKADLTDLDGYIKELESVTAEEFAAMPKDERLAFLINAYNAFSVKMVAENFPVKSFSAIGGTFANPWRKKSEFKLLGLPRALDDIETKLIGGANEAAGPGTGGFADPRFHFAICKMAKDAPRLLNEPYLATKLSVQLTEAARVFITDRLKNGYTASSNSFEVSQVFRWYKADFETASGAQGSLAKYLANNFELEPPLTDVAVKKATVKFVEFDWALNAASSKP